MGDDLTLDGIAFDIARIAHWAMNDRGYTKRFVARDLARLARKVSPAMAEQALGGAANLEPSPASPTQAPEVGE